MIPPLISYVCFNRLGLTVKNLNALLSTSEDFELYIIDSDSTDGTWEYLESISDPRIKEKKRFDVNRYVVYCLNYVLSHRKKGQYFISIDNDVNIHSDSFISKFMNVMNTFPDVGMLGAVRPDWLEHAKNLTIVSDYTLVSKDDIKYIKVTPVVGCFVCLRPELLDVIGYINEETFGADVETCMKINKYTKWHTGIMLSDDIYITQEQVISCKNCTLNTTCKLNSLNKNTQECYRAYLNRNVYKNFAPILRKKMHLYSEDLNSGKREIYCASIHDPESIKNHYYNAESAEENFQYFIDNT